MHSYVSQATHAFLGMQPLCCKQLWDCSNLVLVKCSFSLYYIWEQTEPNNRWIMYTRIIWHYLSTRCSGNLLRMRFLHIAYLREEHCKIHVLIVVVVFIRLVLFGYFCCCLHKADFVGSFLSSLWSIIFIQWMYLYICQVHMKAYQYYISGKSWKKCLREMDCFSFSGDRLCCQFDI